MRRPSDECNCAGEPSERECAEMRGFPVDDWHARDKSCRVGVMSMRAGMTRLHPCDGSRTIALGVTARIALVGLVVACHAPPALAGLSISRAGRLGAAVRLATAAPSMEMDRFFDRRWEISASGLYGAEQPAGRYLKRLQARAERSLGRFGTSLAAAALLWLWLMGATAVFLVSSAVASVVDVRMLDLRPERLRHLRHDLAVGVRLFFRVLRDRRTPLVARLPLLLALGYWLVPFDLIVDSPVFPGFLDDLLFAIAGAKAFLYLCPDAVVLQNAQAIAAAEAGAGD